MILNFLVVHICYACTYGIYQVHKKLTIFNTLNFLCGVCRPKRMHREKYSVGGTQALSQAVLRWRHVSIMMICEGMATVRVYDTASSSVANHCQHRNPDKLII